MRRTRRSRIELQALPRLGCAHATHWRTASPTQTESPHHRQNVAHVAHVVASASTASGVLERDAGESVETADVSGWQYKRSRLPNAARRELAQKYGCRPGETIEVACHWCGLIDLLKWPLLFSGKPSCWPIFYHTIDHVIPLSRGGTHDVSNLVCACSSCNSSRSARTTEEWTCPDWIKRNAKALNRRAA